MKKTALLGGLLIMTLLTLFGCRRTSVIGHLTSFSFSYSTGNMMDASVCYTLKAEDGTVTITIKPDRVPDEQAVMESANAATRTNTISFFIFSLLCSFKPTWAFDEKKITHLQNPDNVPDF